MMGSVESINERIGVPLGLGTYKADESVAFDLRSETDLDKDLIR